MDRELVFIVLCALIFQAALPLGHLLLAGRVQVDARSLSGRALERAATRELAFPLLPSLVGVSALVGWALVEPEEAERLPWFVLALALPMLLVTVRTARRAVLAARVPTIRAAATLGLLRPRVVMDPDFAANLEPATRAAVLAHEQAHARRRDPLRLWVAQILTDLQWPSRSAVERFERFRQAVELSRDEEARRVVDGTDLAAAVLLAARRVEPSPFAMAGVVACASPFRERIERLLAPLPVSPPERASLAFPSLVGIALAVAIGMGTHFGESVIQRLFAQ